jgi:CreA protein
MKIACLMGLAMLMVGEARAEEIGCISTTFRFLGANDKVCVEAFDDPEIPGVACHISQARTGGIKGPLGLAEDPSRFAIACRQTGPIAVTEKISEEREVFSADTSILFKETQVHRMYDRKRNTLVYTAISTKIIEGSPMSAISTVPIVRWEGAGARQ